jgi:hypothetical protein
MRMIIKLEWHGDNGNGKDRQQRRNNDRSHFSGDARNTGCIIVPCSKRTGHLRKFVLRASEGKERVMAWAGITRKSLAMW